MGRIRLTQIFPCLLPLRKKQKIFCYYIGMRLDHNRYSETRSDTMLANPLFYVDWPLYNYETGYELIYQENKAYNCSLAARVLDKVIIAPGETFSFEQFPVLAVHAYSADCYRTAYTWNRPSPQYARHSPRN